LKTVLIASLGYSPEATLLPQGQRECFNAGALFFNRYLDATKCISLGSKAGEPSNTCLSPPGSPGSLSPDGAKYGVVSKPDVTWNNFNVLATSSSLDRTLLSLRSFMAVGLNVKGWRGVESLTFVFAGCVSGQKCSHRNPVSADRRPAGSSLFVGRKGRG
jgi:hypothetical protein